MSKDSTNSSPDDLPIDPDFDPDATIEQSETKIDSYRAMYAPSTPLPETIGKYRILSEIGEGGMGTVYEAEQDSPRRKVALKVIKAGVASKNLLLRFEIEAQILGKLDHPGIATIFEAGTFDEGHGKQPFFAMEFVHGELLTDYADKHKLGTRDRLGLLAKIADAVQHAHQKGVIHRDLKPGNILVNNEGQIKILDFGVARATDADIQTVTMQTDIGQLIGTIPYMSPEQASGNPDDLDTRSDVYALGIIGYELLTGQMPYDVKQKMIHEAVRVICEDEPKTLSSINKTFRGDVEIIVSKALIKEKSRRYQSASDLASDIHRYLNNEPIDARPPSTWYHLSKFSRRNKALVAGISAVLVVSVVGALVSINFAMGEAEQKRIAIQAAEDARTAEENTQRELTRANEVKKLITDMFSSIRPEVAQGQDITLLKGILDDTSHRLTSGEIKDELIAAEMHAVLGEVYRRLGLFPEAELHVPAAVEIQTRLLTEENSVTLNSMNSLAALYRNQGRYAEAEIFFLQILEIRTRVLEDDHPYLQETMNNLALVYWDQGQYAAAQPLFLQALETRTRVLGEEHPSTLSTRSNLAALYFDQGRYAEAEPLFFQTLEIQKRVLGEEHLSTLDSMNNLVNLYLLLGQYAKAEPLSLQTVEIRTHLLGEEHPKTCSAMNNLAGLYTNQGRYTKAEPLYLQTLEIQTRVLGNEHPATLESMSNLANIYGRLNRHDEAETLKLQTLEIRNRVLGKEHPDTLISMQLIASSFERQGRYAEAESLMIQILEIRKRVLGLEHSRTLGTLGNLANLYTDQKRYDEAEPLYLQSLEIKKRTLGKENPDSLITKFNLSLLYAKQGRYDDAELLMFHVLEAQIRVLGEEHPDTLKSMYNLMAIYSKQGRYEETVAILLQSLEIKKRVLGEEHPDTVGTMNNLANLYLYLERYTEPVHGELLLMQLASAGAADADVTALNGAAWSLLTHKAADLRDPIKALAYATRACDAEETAGAGNLWMHLNTLALAQYMTGDTAAAVKTQQRTVSLMPEGEDPSVAESLARYESALADEATEVESDG